MNFGLSLDHANETVLLTFFGEVTAKDLWRSRTDATAALEAHQWRRVMVDVLHAFPGVLTDEVFEFTAGHAEAFPRGTRIAVVAPEGRLAEFTEFAVTVARNRGFVMQSFRDVEAAGRWLAG